MTVPARNSHALEEEFFAVEGRPHPGSNAACAYVSTLEFAPNGDRITTAERAALWYLAYWSDDGIARPSVMALAMHIDCGVRETRRVLADLVRKGLLSSLLDPDEWRENDVHAYLFVEVPKG